MTPEDHDCGPDGPVTDDDLDYAAECARRADEEAAWDAAEQARHEAASYPTTDDDDPDTIPW